MKKHVKLALTALLSLTFLAACNTPSDLPSVSYDDVAVKGVELNKQSLTLKIGETYQLNATISYREGKEEAEVFALWNSSNPSVASVSETGLVTALGSGNATISYIAGFKMAVCSVYVPAEGEDTPTAPTSQPTSEPTSQPTSEPTSGEPTSEPSGEPTSQPTSGEPTSEPTSGEPTSGPTSEEPTSQPTSESSTSDDDWDEDEDKECTVFFFIDYNNIDESDTTGTKLLASFKWYGDRPLSESGLVPQDPTTPLDPAFPYFIGWSSHTVIDSKADLWNMTNDVIGNGYYFYLYGIWSDVSAGEFVK